MRKICYYIYLMTFFSSQYISWKWNKRFTQPHEIQSVHSLFELGTWAFKYIFKIFFLYLTLLWFEFCIHSSGPPDRNPQPTRLLTTATPPRLHLPTDPRKHDRQGRPHRPPQKSKPAHPNSKPNICDGGFNTLAILRQRAVRLQGMNNEQLHWEVEKRKLCVS